MLLMYFLYLILQYRCPNRRDTNATLSTSSQSVEFPDTAQSPHFLPPPQAKVAITDLVDLHTIDLTLHEHAEDSDDILDDETREANLRGKWGWAWRAWYLLA